MLLHPFKATLPSVKNIVDLAGYFDQVKKKYGSFKDQSFFTEETVPSYFIYKIAFENRSFISLVASIDIQDYIDAKVLKHEKTLAEKKEKSKKYIEREGVIMKPPLIICEVNPGLSRYVNDYLMNHETLLEIQNTADHSTHSVWQISDKEEMANLQNTIKEHPDKFYIADGHHRFAGFADLYKNSALKDTYTRIPCVVMDFGDVEIHPFNRLLKLPTDWDEENFIKSLDSYFHVVEKTDDRLYTNKFEITMILKDRNFQLKWKEEVLSNEADDILFDASLLDKHVFSNLLGMSELDKESKINFIPSYNDLRFYKKKIEKKFPAVVFLIYPVAETEWKTVSDNFETLPPKSTFILPRIEDGLFIKSLEA